MGVRQARWFLGLLVLSCGSEPLGSSHDYDEPAQEQDDAPKTCEPPFVELSLLVASDELASELGVGFASCGAAHAPSGPLREPCCASATVHRQCLVEALERCTPARYVEVTTSVEGDPIVLSYFVVPNASSCQLVVLEDASRDAYLGPGEPLVVSHCEGVLVPRATSGCPRLEPKGCSRD